MKSRICIIAPPMSGRGGTESALIEFTNILIRNKYEVNLLFPEDTQYNEWKNGFIQSDSLHLIVNKQYNKVGKSLFIAYNLFRIKPKLVVCMGPNMIRFVSKIKKYILGKIKIYSWVHFTLKNLQFINISHMKFADEHLVISNGIKQQLIDMNIPKERIHVIFNSVKHTEYSIESSRDTFLNLLYVGRITFEGQKNLKLGIDALSKVEIPWKLTVIGSGKDERKIKEYIQAKNLPDNSINWLGWSDNPWLDVKKMDALLLTSNYEGFPMVLLEALSRGLPCISANCETGPSDIIKNQVNGYLFEMNNSEDLKQKLEIFYPKKANFDRNVVKKSISTYYEENYESKLIELLS
ncbi:glycosyltransferase [Enterococcus italicus]|nr:glycosyltransferase [Enterococcus italicus]MCM6932166.1 glycosyltransferase [Enterococcus italicus]OJG58258.1 hypothetical protein RT43_GL000857 [Enterococcus italicus DSM 15952]